MTENQTPKKQPKQPSIHAGHRQRVKERYLKSGADSFDDHQLLELMLFYALPQKDTNSLAHELINRFGSLKGVLSATPVELKQVKGMGDSAAVLLNLVPELMRRVVLSREKQTLIHTAEEAGEYLYPYFQGSRTEQVYLLCMNQRDEILGCDLMATGNDVSVGLDTKAMVEVALRHKASWVVLAHSHPSGFAIPSESDMMTTKHCRDLLKSLGITLKDHLIFADNDYLSMKQSKLF